MTVGVVVIQCIQDTKFQRIHFELQGKFVIELLLRDGCLGNTESAKCASGNYVGVDSARHGSDNSEQSKVPMHAPERAPQQ